MMNAFVNAMKRSILIALLAFAVAGCGGGGGGGGTADGGNGGGNGGGGDGPGGGGNTPTPVAATPFGTTLLAELDEESFSAGVAISDAGTAVGYATNGSDVKGVKWNVANPDVATILPPLPGNSYSAAYGVNDDGMAVGESGVLADETADATTAAVLWSSANAVTRLEAPPGHAGPYAAYAINASGLIVGESAADQEGNTEAVLWTGTEVVSLHQPGWEFSAAYAIHDDGMIVGEAQPAGGPVQGVIWMPSGAGFTATLLPPAGGDASSVAFGIDDLGRIVGESEGEEGVRGIVWTVNVQGNAIAETQILEADTSLQAVDNGRMVGYAASRASVWNAEDVDDSQGLAEAFSQAYGVNANSQIVGILGNRAFFAMPEQD